VGSVEKEREEREQFAGYVRAPQRTIWTASFTLSFFATLGI
jgi:hypothetical protein